MHHFTILSINALDAIYLLQLWGPGVNGFDCERP